MLLLASTKSMGEGRCFCALVDHNLISHHFLGLPERQFAIWFHRSPFPIAPKCPRHIAFAILAFNALLGHKPFTSSLAPKAKDTVPLANLSVQSIEASVSSSN